MQYLQVANPTHKAMPRRETLAGRGGSPSRFLFLDLSQPSSVSKKDVRRQIRSHVTKAQHKRRRDNSRAVSNRSVASRVSPSSDSSSAEESNEASVSETSHQGTIGQTVLESTNDPTWTYGNWVFEGYSVPCEKSMNTHSIQWSHCSWQNSDAHSASSDETSPTSSEATLEFAIQSPNFRPHPSDDEMLVAKGVAAFQNVIYQDRSEVFGNCIRRLGFSMQSIMEHYILIAETQAPGLDTRYRIPGMVRRVWMPFLLTDSASICTIFLVAILHLWWSAGNRLLSRDLLALKSFVYATVNTALRDPQRSCNDQTIISVFNLALCEVLFGSQEMYHLHMMGLMRIIDFRLGIGTLGQEGYIEQVMVWYDANCADIMGCERYLERVSAMLPSPPSPNRASFSVGLIAD